eukprot:NODE_45_length_27728_cov_0.328387.p19 type:complete len:160 gc:universal NODE_45_length_27728_cov_0.328387:11192-10713(-)
MSKEGLWLSRLIEERKGMRKERPAGFFAAPKKTAKGELNFKIWLCKIPGPDGSPFEGGLFNLELLFSDSYPQNPPEVIFKPALFHPNIYTTGHVCLSLLQNDWKPSISIVTLLINLRDFLKTPNIKSPANGEAAKLFARKDKKTYNDKVKALVKRFPAD